MTGATWYADERRIVDRQMEAFDQMPLNERLEKGRIAYEAICWNKRTAKLRAVVWMGVGMVASILLKQFGMI